MSDFVNGWCPTPPLQEKPTWRLQVARYGDGYQQRMLDGINALDNTYSVTFENRAQSVLFDMEAYLVRQKSRAFNFKHPVSGVILRVFCNEWNLDWSLVRWDETGRRTVYGTLSADFIKANGVGLDV